MGNQIQTEILDTIEIMVKRYIEKAGLDKTIIGTVTGVLDDFHYKVFVDGIERNIYSAIDMSFQVGNAVLVTCPQGSFNNAFISGRKRK